MKRLLIGGLLIGVIVGCGREESATCVAKGAEETPPPPQSEVATVERLENAVEKEDFEDALACVTELARSQDANVRLRCVESIGWFGGKSARTLIPFLADPNEDVRSEAQDQWDSAVNDIEDEREKGSLVEEAMTLVRDREVMEAISFQLNDLPPTLSIDIIVHLIAGSNGVARIAAKEAYEYVTGDDWKSAAAAQKWLEENVEDEDDD